MQNDLQLKKLDIKDLSNLINLQDKIIKDFHPDEQHFILHRTAEDFMKALKSETTQVFGLYDGKNLVAQSILSLPNDNQDRELGEFLPEIPNSQIAIYKAVLVDPEYRGKGLMKEMLKIRETTAIMNNRSTAITQIAADNPASWINAIRHGMEISKVDFDPEDNAKVIYLNKDLTSNSQKDLTSDKYHNLSLGKDVHKNIPVLFNKMQQLAQKGYKAIGWNKETNNLVWHVANEKQMQKMYPLNTSVLELRSSQRT